MDLTRHLQGLAAAGLTLAAGAAVAQDGAPLPYGDALIWQVSPPGQGTESVVMGTMHVSDPRVIALADRMEDVILDAQTLVVEVALTPEAQMVLAGAMIDMTGPPLDDRLGPADFERLAGIVEGYGLPRTMLQRMQPWAAAILISVPEVEYARMSSGAPVLDQQLEDLAETAGIGVVGLETVEEQLAALSGLDEELQIEQLRVAIGDHDRIDAIFEQMLHYYLSGDLSGFHNWMLDQMAGADPELVAAFLDTLIDQRNVRMADRVRPFLNDGGAFVAIGALHLPGPNGVLARLADQGYAITPYADVADGR